MLHAHYEQVSNDAHLCENTIVASKGVKFNVVFTKDIDLCIKLFGLLVSTTVYSVLKDSHDCTVLLCSKIYIHIIAIT